MKKCRHQRAPLRLVYSAPAPTPTEPCPEVVLAAATEDSRWHWPVGQEPEGTMAEFWADVRRMVDADANLPED